MTVMELMDMVPNEQAAHKWFENILWAEGRCCGHCGGTRTKSVPDAKPMPFFCNDCRKYFSIRTGTPMASSRIPLRKWVVAIYLCVTSLKGVSSMKLHRDIGVSQPAAWFMLQRIREAWTDQDDGDFNGPVEVDETYMGGKRGNMSNAQREKLVDAGRGAVGKTAVVGIKDRETNEVRAEVIQSADSETLVDFIGKHAEPGARVYTDEARATRPLIRRTTSMTP